MTGHFHDELADEEQKVADAKPNSVIPDIHIEMYPIELDRATAIFGSIGDVDTFYEPIDLVTFDDDADADAVFYFLAFNDVVQRAGVRTFTLPDGWPCKQWLAENCPEAKIEHHVWIMFESSASKRAFEDALMAEASDGLLAYLAHLHAVEPNFS